MKFTRLAVVLFPPILNAFRATPLPTRSIFQHRLSSTRASFLKCGDKVLVEVQRFGPLGASVVTADNQTGLILQREIASFRKFYPGSDINIGDRVNAYVQKIREDSKLNLSLRPIGIERYKETKTIVERALRSAKGGVLPLGDKSSPEEIDAVFPGVSKVDFKAAIGLLLKEGTCRPREESTIWIDKTMPQEKRRQPQPSARRGSQSTANATGISNVKTNQVRPIRSNFIFIGRLPDDCTTTELRCFLETVLGKETVGRLELGYSENGRFRGFAKLEVSSDRQTELAVRKLSGIEFKGCLLRSDFTDSRRTRQEEILSSPRSRTTTHKSHKTPGPAAPKPFHRSNTNTMPLSTSQPPTNRVRTSNKILHQVSFDVATQPKLSVLEFMAQEEANRHGAVQDKDG